MRDARDSQRRRGTMRAGRMDRILSIPAQYLSATVAILLAAIVLIGYPLFEVRDVVTFAVVAGILVLAHGWADLVRAPAKYMSAVTILLTGLLAVVAVRLTDDYAWATVALGLVVLIAAIMEMTRPLPRANLVQSLSSSAFGGFVAVTGVAWITLCRSELWAAIMMTAASLVIVTVIGNQLGRTVRANALWAFVFAVAASVAASLIAISMGRPAGVLSITFGRLVGSTSAEVSLVAVSVLMGLGVAAVVVIVDVLFGEHERRISEAGALARGAAKFLLAVMPIYVIARVGALL
ncbi:MAG: hypothetical protein Q4E01_05905 [Actinomycetaceae bacterium]|nr:hypothetical protein [Actinomycetaceae bacterium]